MATALVTGDFLSIRAWTTQQAQAAVNTFNYQVITLTGGAVTDQDFVNAQNTAFAAFYKSLCPSSVDYNGIQCYFLFRTGGGSLPAPVKNIASAGPGTTGTNCVPRNAAGIMKYSAFSRGPGGRGRVFLPFVSLDYVNEGGDPNTAYDVLVNSFASSLLTPVVVTSGGSTATLSFCLFKRSNVAASEQILQAESASKFGQMHKRGDYGRPNASPI